MLDKRLPIACPGCGNVLTVKRFECDACETAVEGHFDLPPLSRLDREDQDFVLKLVLSSGSLKELAGAYGVSYPTVRNRLDTLVVRVHELRAATERNSGE